MLTVKVYNQEGSEVKDLELNEAVFGIEPNKQALFDMVLLQNMRLAQTCLSAKVCMGSRTNMKKQSPTGI